MDYELPTLSKNHHRHSNCQAPSIEGWQEKQTSHNAGAATAHAVNGQIKERKCKKCGIQVGKGKIFCASCRKPKRKPSNNHWAPRDNFIKDQNGELLEKFCTKCKKWLDVGCFGFRADTRSGLRPRCKSCEKSIQQLRSAQNKKPTKTHEKECQICGVNFQAKNKREKYCSDNCRNQSALIKCRAKNNSIHVALHQTCKRCKITKPIADFKTEKYFSGFKIMPTVCASCKTENHKIHKKNSRKKSRKNPKNRVRHSLSKRFREIMNSAKSGGSSRLRDFIGCSTHHLRKHLESQFSNGMKWDNYGDYWHVDHILPVSSFDHSDINQISRCWHFTNLRPMLASENLAKSNSIVTCQPELLLQLP